MIAENLRYEEKAWGRVMHVFAKWHSAVSYLEVAEKTRSSWHRHHCRANHFVCLSGEIVVEIEEQELVSRIVLVTGDSYTVPAMVWHRFRVLSSGSLIELYWCDGFQGGTVNESDIERRDEGGADDQGDLMDAGVLL
jgi:mannose-6-phosphate isomerase-like protein (cupin superfamily)